MKKLLLLPLLLITLIANSQQIDLVNTISGKKWYLKDTTTNVRFSENHVFALFLPSSQSEPAITGNWSQEGAHIRLYIEGCEYLFEIKSISPTHLSILRGDYIYNFKSIP